MPKKNKKKKQKKTSCVSTEVEVPIKDLTLCNHRHGLEQQMGDKLTSSDVATQ